jgi:hypothetical protein
MDKKKFAAESADGFGLRPSVDDVTEARVDEIEMLGEEESAGFTRGRSDIDPNVRFLHCSRTIHQLVTDRNRAVGLYLAVASLLWTASGAILNARPAANLIVPIEAVQRWCLPVTLGILSVLALFTSLLLIRTRIGLIYEVAKMNVLLGLPVGRVQRVNPLSLFFLMHLLVCAAGGCCATFFAYHLFRLFAPELAAPMVYSATLGAHFTAGLVVLYIVMVMQTTAERKLDQRAR